MLRSWVWNQNRVSFGGRWLQNPATINNYGFSCKRHMSFPWQELCCIISKAFCLNFTSFFAIGGRQFKVTINDTIVINRIDADTGERIRIEKASTKIWGVSIHWNRTIMKNICQYLPLTIIIVLILPFAQVMRRICSNKNVIPLHVTGPHDWWWKFQCHRNTITCVSTLPLYVSFITLHKCTCVTIVQMVQMLHVHVRKGHNFYTFIFTNTKLSVNKIP